MRATVKKRVAVFPLQGFIDGTNAPFFIPLDDMKHTYNLKVDLILISFKKVVYFNVNGLEILTEILMNFRKKMNVVVGFCDIDKSKYDTILRFNKNDLNFSLFQNLQTAFLFANNETQEDQKRILIWNDDQSQRNSIAIDLFERGHNPIVAQNINDFKKRKKDSDAFDMIIENTYLGNYGYKIATRVTSNAVIYTLKGFLDAEINDNFDLTYHTNSLNNNFKLFIFDATQVVSINIHALNFFTKLSSTGAEYNATIAIIGLNFSKVPKNYKEELEDAGIIFFELLGDIIKNKELMLELTGSSSSKMQTQRNINKILVNNLPHFIDAAVSSFEMMTNTKAEKQSAAIQPLTINLDQELFCSSIGFYGDIDGIIMLIFPVDIANKACSLLLGEDNPSQEDTLDAISEFVNIIGGRVKAILAENESLQVDITLPRTYTDIDALINLLAERKGVQVDLLLGTQIFNFFLTR